MDGPPSQRGGPLIVPATDRMQHQTIGVTLVSSKQTQKIVQYLNEAHGAESALVRQLQAQIAMTPKGSYRNGLETHLQETRSHAERVEVDWVSWGRAATRFSSGWGSCRLVVGQALALTKTPIDLVRGTGGEEKVLKNAKDSCAAEALEIATYTALARLARTAGDTRPSGSPTRCWKTSSGCSAGC